MDILYLLIPLSAVLALAILGVFAWALHGGQFDDLEAVGEAILELDSSPPPRSATPPAWNGQTKALRGSGSAGPLQGPPRGAATARERGGSSFACHSRITA